MISHYQVTILFETLDYANERTLFGGMGGAIWKKVVRIIVGGEIGSLPAVESRRSRLSSMGGFFYGMNLAFFLPDFCR